MYKITIEGPDFKEPVVLEYARCHITQEQGIAKVYDRGAYSFGHPVHLTPNGQKRACVKLWTGCEYYETFVASEEVTL